ncbi:MAG: oxidoreductase [Aeromicrobium erythreum]
MTITSTLPGGAWTLGEQRVPRFGLGTMQLAGPGVMGPPADRAAAVELVREAVALGVTHLDTSGAYGPHVVNEIVREAVQGASQDVLVATKVGADRDADGGWPTARTPEDLRRQVHENLTSLGVERLDLVHLRMGDATGPRAESLVEPFEALVAMQREGLVRDVGLSNVTREQVAQARDIAPVVSVQNLYNLAQRDDDDLVDELAADGIAYVPFFPLGGFSPLQADALSAVARRRGSTPRAVALAWLLRRSPNILLIPGTSRLEHLRANVAGAELVLSDDDVAELDGIGTR